jgi:hypothetical protein
VTGLWVFDAGTVVGLIVLEVVRWRRFGSRHRR